MTLPSGYRSSHQRANLAARYVLPLAWQALTATSGLVATARMMSRWRRHRTEPRTSLAKWTGSVSYVEILFLDGVLIRIFGRTLICGCFQQCARGIDGNQWPSVFPRVFDSGRLFPPGPALQPEKGRRRRVTRHRHLVGFVRHCSVGLIRRRREFHGEVLAHGLRVYALRAQACGDLLVREAGGSHRFDRIAVGFGRLILWLSARHRSFL